MTTDNTQGLVEILNNLGERHIMAEHGLVGSKDAETERAVKRILDWHNKQVEEVIKKPHILPNAQNRESVEQCINFYHRQMRKRVDKLKEANQ